MTQEYEMQHVEAQQEQLSKKIIIELNVNYIKMYRALVSINFGWKPEKTNSVVEQNISKQENFSSKTLGMARYEALKQMKSFVDSKIKNTNHPMNNELMNIHTKFSKQMYEHIMKSPYSESKLQDNVKDVFTKTGNVNCRQAQKALNEMYEEYMPKQKVKTPVKKIFAVARKSPQPLVTHIMLQQMRQRAA